MLSAHITSFLKLISTQLEETSRGVTSSHHFHNVQCGIENILSLLEYNSEDADRLDATYEALAGFRFAVEHSQPNSRVRTLGLA